ncbi:MAG: tetratricopeptide repeat protein [Myxococcota bacterium]
MSPFVIALLLVTAGTASLDKGVEELANVRLRQAIALLERARHEGPYNLQQHRQLYESIAIAYASLGLMEPAVAAFERLLVLDPDYAVAPGTSPKVVEPFQRAQQFAAKRSRSSVSVVWHINQVGVVEAEMFAKQVNDDFQRAQLWYRQAPQEFEVTTVRLAEVGTTQVLGMEELSPSGGQLSIEYFVVVLDTRGNEVAKFGTANAPMRAVLTYEPPPAWYKKPWIWAAVGGVVAVGIGVGVYVVTRPPEHSTVKIPIP